MDLSRRFLYVVVEQCSRWRSPCSTIHRIKPSRLFVPDGLKDRARAATLPVPRMSFEHSGRMQFSLLGKDKIVGVDEMGRSVLYDDGSHTVRPLPSMAPPESWRTLSVAVDGVGAAEDGGSVYIIDAEPLQDLPGQPVHELVYELNNEDSNEDWIHWSSLPPPPYAHAPGCCEDGGSRAEITCHAVAVHSKDDRALVWVSTAGQGTYWLDTATRWWTKAGDWVLPFRGQAMTDRALGLWIGFSAVDSGHICGSDLAAAADEDRPPAVDHVWEGFAVPEGFHEMYSRLVYLGGRRFCVAKIFKRTPKPRPSCWSDSPDEDEGQCFGMSTGPPDEDEGGGKCFAMFTGVEVVHGRGKYRMIKHRSLRYSLGETFDGCVL